MATLLWHWSQPVDKRWTANVYKSVERTAANYRLGLDLLPFTFGWYCCPPHTHTLIRRYSTFNWPSTFFFSLFVHHILEDRLLIRKSQLAGKLNQSGLGIYRFDNRIDINDRHPNERQHTIFFFFWHRQSKLIWLRLSLSPESVTDKTNPVIGPRHIETSHPKQLHNHVSILFNLFISIFTQHLALFLNFSWRISPQKFF